jgi:hypothetical protein
MKWITREKARVDRIACPWLIKRFIDRDAIFLFDRIRFWSRGKGAAKPYLSAQPSHGS